MNVIHSTDTSCSTNLVARSSSDRELNLTDFALSRNAFKSLWKLRCLIAIVSALAVALTFGQSVASGAYERPDRMDLTIYQNEQGEFSAIETLSDWAIRRGQIVDAMQSVMGRVPGEDRRCDLEIEVLESVDCGTYQRQLISYQSEPGSRVPAYLLVPKDIDAPRPAMLCLHPTDNTVGHKVVVGLGGRPNRQYAEELAERGFVTIAPAYPLLANYQPDLESLGYLSGTMKAIWDNMRAIDLLSSLDEVDAERIGAIGHSLGGHNSVYTAVIDPRIKVVVSSCGLDSFVDYKDGDIRGWTSTRYMPRLLNFRDQLESVPFDFAELIGALAPRPCLIIAPYGDSNFKWESVDRLAAVARSAYEHFEQSIGLQVAHPDCDHDFPQYWREQAYAFIERSLTQDRIVPNTQAETIPLLSGEEALQKLRPPSGFEASLFASEPMVRQPVAMTFDSRGRLWIAENDTYSDRDQNFDLSLFDRVVVFTDQDGNGQADERHVFWEGGQKLTSIEYGFGGVWALCPPQLLFIPDRDRDDQPDGPPIVMLEGWDDSVVRHNFVNGLKWGPDGWLYGRHGIQATSIVGTPDTPESKRTPINCGIWRFHPVTHEFEVVCNGTTNPWGMDWNEHGELFFINTVIGHLWHAIPGAHFERMYGVDFNPYLFELMKQTADHVHWDDSSESWTAQKNGLSEGTDQAGGGHAHSGMMIYQGTQWPDEYHGELFTLNFHGRRINQEHLERHQSTYVGRHRDDFLFSDDEWFRGVELGYGPYGAVYMLDWSDIGECHENDGIHRTSGRIYEIRHAAQSREQMRVASGLPLSFDLESWDSSRLVEAQFGDNEWLVRQARRILQERSMSFDDRERQSVVQSLSDVIQSADDEKQKLRALWALAAMGVLSENELISWLEQGEGEHFQAWVIQLLARGRGTSFQVDPGTQEDEVQLTSVGNTSPATTSAFMRLSEKPLPGLVRVYLASALQRMPNDARLALAQNLLNEYSNSVDDVFSLMIWYGIEPAVADDPEVAMQFLSQCTDGRLCRFVTRRLLADTFARSETLELIVRWIASGTDRAFDETMINVVLGIREAAQGWARQTMPDGWPDLLERVADVENEALQTATQELSVVFGEGRALDAIVQLISDSNGDPVSRQSAIATIVDVDPERAVTVLMPLVDDRVVGASAIRGLAQIGPEGLTEVLLERYDKMRRLNRLAAIDAIASQPTDVRLLLDAIDQQKIDRSEIPPFVLRQMQLLGDAELAQRILEIWPERKLIDVDKLELISHYQRLLTPEKVDAADLERGHELFVEHCGACHKLFGEGGDLAPDLTGGQRSHINFWLENLIEPSAEVAADFRMSMIMLENGRVINGVVLRESAESLLLRTPTEEQVIRREDVLEIQPSTLSLMPEGILEAIADEQALVDLFGYLMMGTRTEQTASPTDSTETTNNQKRLLYVAEPGIRNYTRFGGHGIIVFDIDEDYRFVKRIPMPGLNEQGEPLNVKGICGNATTDRLYVSTIRHLICLDLKTDEVLWEREYPLGCDRMSMSPDGRIIYQPSFEKDIWYVLNAETGEEIARVEPRSRAHNTVYGNSGDFVYLAGLASNMLSVADTSSHEIVRQVGPFAASIRPFTIDSSETRCYVNVNGLLGFEIGDLTTGEKLARVEVEGYRQGPVARHGCPSHGIGMTPDETQIWVTDGHNECLHVFDLTEFPPRQIDTIELREQPGWITFSRDGKTCWPSTGDVIDVESRQIVARLFDEVGRMVMSEKLVEVIIEGDDPIFVGDQFGKGQSNE